MRKLIIDGNAVYELDEKCMLVRRIDDSEQEEERNHLTREKDRVYDNNNLK